MPTCRLPRLSLPPSAGLALLIAGASTLIACPGSTEPVRGSSRPDATQPAARRDPCLERPRRLAAPETAPWDTNQARDAFDRGTRLEASGEWGAAERAYAAAVELWPGFGLAHLRLAEALAYTGGSARQRVAHLSAALLDLPRNPRAHVRLADALEETDDAPGALVHLGCALALDGRLDDARRHAVRLALELEGPAAAEARLDPLLHTGPSASDWIVASDVYAAGGNLDGAADAMQKAAQTAKSAPLYRRAAGLWERAQNPERAEAAKDRADALDPPERRKMRPLRPSRR